MLGQPYLKTMPLLVKSVLFCSSLALASFSQELNPHLHPHAFCLHINDDMLALGVNLFHAESCNMLINPRDIGPVEESISQSGRKRQQFWQIIV